MYSKVELEFLQAWKFSNRLKIETLRLHAKNFDVSYSESDTLSAHVST